MGDSVHGLTKYHGSRSTAYANGLDVHISVEEVVLVDVTHGLVDLISVRRAAIIVHDRLTLQVELLRVCDPHSLSHGYVKALQVYGGYIQMPCKTLTLSR